ncbi:hypothetical protein KKB10_03690 [Patescibacteria group bacterium]|nr:hypothetical protein [Patescibacteria group bacterium]MBU1074753.1 hypothetical protein [Patescibacteria group bacterium]MBU1952542.1 hypothetical protein [Patescibacteria group bacterium]
MSDIKQDVHGHKVLGESSAKNGINHLDHKLDMSEAEVFFTQAKTHGSAEFEDEKGRNYTLTRNSDATYTVEKRKDSSGWF